MDLRKEYQKKQQSLEKILATIPHQAKLGVGMAMSQPAALLKRIEQQVQDGVYKELKLFYMHAQAPLMESLLKYEHMSIVKPHPFFMTGRERELSKKGIEEGRKLIFYMPANFSSVPKILQEVGLDAFVLTVSPMDEAGYMSCGTNSDYTIPSARMARHLIVEVNRHMPRTFGDCCLHISEVHALLENHTPLPTAEVRPPNDLDRKIGEIIVEMIPHRATVQFGIGGIPNAVAEMLAHHKDLGIHTELMSPGLAKLIQSGAVTNRYKVTNPHKNVYTVAIGSQEMYDFMNNNPSMEAHPVAYVNNPYIIGQNPKTISVSSFLQVDLSGQVNAESMNGRQYSAPGGQLDFVRGAQISEGGKSMLTAYSTAVQGTVSRIVGRLEGPATDPRADTHYIVTEYGAVNLRGKSTHERAKALIEIAHPNFRDGLMGEAQKLGFLC